MNLANVRNVFRKTHWLYNAGGIFFGIFLALILSGSTLRIPNAEFPVDRVVHAGGSIDGYTYLNSIEALNASLNNGFRYFELDFMLTADKKIVCLRNWSDDFISAFDFQTERRLTYAEFKELAGRLANGKARCDQGSLLQWVRSNPSAKIITDFKEHNLMGLLILSRNFPKESIIPQVYSLSEYFFVRDLGFDHIIWTLYRSSLTDDEVVEQIKKYPNITVVAMPKSRASRGLPLRLNDLGVSSYVHTVNGISEYHYYKLQGIAEIYTDSLVPGSVP